MVQVCPLTAEVDGDFVVFLVGARINKPWKIHKWLPVALAMPRMLKELASNPDSGLLAYEQSGYDSTTKGRLPDLLPEWSVRGLMEAGAQAIKILWNTFF